MRRYRSDGDVMPNKIKVVQVGGVWLISLAVEAPWGSDQNQDLATSRAGSCFFVPND